MLEEALGRQLFHDLLAIPFNSRRNWSEGDFKNWWEHLARQPSYAQFEKSVVQFGMVKSHCSQLIGPRARE